ncbi:hypothetical protein OTB16_10300 [Streptomyces sp. H27-S2]|nr:hypothetical protein [Streptomyces sp. H27-S2]
MWDGCTPVLGAEPDPPRREITAWQIPGIGEMDIESEGYRMSVLPTPSLSALGETSRFDGLA